MTRATHTAKNLNITVLEMVRHLTRKHTHLEETFNQVFGDRASMPADRLQAAFACKDTERRLESTLADLVQYLLHQHPHLTERIATVANLVEGKGYGTATIEAEVQLAIQLGGRIPKLAVDIGCNVGHYTQALRHRSTAMEIHGFEPSAVNVRQLLARFKSDPLVTIIPMAVSDRVGEATLYSDRPGSGMASLAHRQLDHLNIPFHETEPVRTIRFESYWREALQSRPLDLVKLDIEGYELAALEGFGAALAATRVLQFEFGGCNIDTRTYFRDFWNLLVGQGFRLFRITPLGAQAIEKYRESDEYFSTTNFLAVNAAVSGSTH